MHHAALHTALTYELLTFKMVCFLNSIHWPHLEPLTLRLPLYILHTHTRTHTHAPHTHIHTTHTHAPHTHTVPPSPPLNVREVSRSSTTIMLAWEEPLSTGGRNRTELRYNLWFRAAGETSITLRNTVTTTTGTIDGKTCATVLCASSAYYVLGAHKL